MHPKRVALLVAGALAAATVTASFPSEVDAQAASPSKDDLAAAAEEFDLGRKAFKAEEFVEAAEHFEKADSRAPAVTALENAIRSRDKAGQLERAATLAALGLARHPGEASFEKVARAVLARAEKELHRVQVRCDSPCDLVLDNKLVHGAAATSRELWLQPGAHNVRAEWSEGRTAAQPVEAKKAGSSELAFTAPPIPEKPAREPSPTEAKPSAARPAAGEPSRSRRDAGDAGGGLPPGVFWAGVGLTVVAGGITAWSGIDTQNDPGADTVRERCAGLGTNCPEYQRGVEKQDRTNLLAIVTGGVGALTLVIGLFATDWGTEAPPPAAAASPRRPQAAQRRISPWAAVDSAQGIVGAEGSF
ncbi:MAG: hypothetical protein IT376_05590 [Polyangiaceae bacterium]|nr:hypothetical protein [Polyangiaceae bacterium]